MNNLTLWLTVILLSPCLIAAESSTKKSESKQGEAKEISGISIVGNDETPKSLFIVPWKSSEIGFESELTAQSLLDGSLRPLDKEVFNRELDYFDIRESNSNTVE